MIATDKSVSKNNLSKYHVQSRDTLCRIAVNYNTTTSKLMKLNKLQTTLIFPGQVLLVPHNEETTEINGSEKLNGLPPPIATTMEDAYDFLSPLCGSSYSGQPSSLDADKPFKDLSVVSSSKHRMSGNLENEVKSKKPMLFYNEQVECMNTKSSNDFFHVQSINTDCFDKDDSLHRLRSISIESCPSEPFEENFLKLNVHYLTAALEHVSGILLVTPTSAMFDPDPTCPLAKEHGCEKYGLMVELKHIITLTMYREASCQDSERNNLHSPDSGNDDDNQTDAAENKAADTTKHDSSLTDDDFARESGFVTLSFPKDESKGSSSSHEKVAKEHTFQKPKVTTQSSANEAEFNYFCIRSSEPIMKTYSVITALSKPSENDKAPQDLVKEAWFHVPRRSCDQMMAFFMQYSPDPYALDFAEQNGFVVADVLDRKMRRRKKKRVSRDDDVRSRSSTSSSSVEQSTEEYIGTKKVEKEWELVSIEEAKRRTQFNANELANDDTSLIPELRHESNLIKDDALLELCRRMPARCIGCPWKLLYSTFEHGMSLRTLYRKMALSRDDDVDCDTPAFLIIRDTEGHVFGAFTSSRPRLSEHFYGSGESFLFTLEPQITFFEWSGENNFFVQGDTDCLKFGGGDGSAGLWIDGDLHHGRSRHCLTYNNSILSSSEDFFIQDVEVWGFDDC